MIGRNAPSPLSTPILRISQPEPPSPPSRNTSRVNQKKKKQIGVREAVQVQGEGVKRGNKVSGGSTRAEPESRFRLGVGRHLAWSLPAAPHLSLDSFNAYMPTIRHGNVVYLTFLSYSYLTEFVISEPPIPRHPLKLSLLRQIRP